MHHDKDRLHDQGRYEDIKWESTYSGESLAEQFGVKRTILFIGITLLATMLISACSNEPEVQKVYVNTQGHEIALSKNEIVINDKVVDTVFGKDFNYSTKEVYYKKHSYIQVYHHQGISIVHDPECNNIKHNQDVR